MKKLILLIFVFNINQAFAQSADIDLNGKVFTGTAVEITPPDVDRMPLQYDEVIRIIDGKVLSDLMNYYSAVECNYTAVTDGRRMIAIEIIDLKFKTIGAVDGKVVTIDFTGIVAARLQLAGELVIGYPDGHEVKFTVTAKSD